MKKTLHQYLWAGSSGVLLSLSFPTPEWWPLAFIGLAPLLVALAGQDPKRSFGLGFVFGLPFFTITSYWVYHSMHFYGGVSLPVSYLAVLLMAAYLSLYPAIFSVFFSRSLVVTTLPALLLAPVFWVIFEYVRSILLTGYPGGVLGYSQYKILPLIQIADITGVYGISFLIVAVNGAIADFFIFKTRSKHMPLFNQVPTVIGLSVLGVALLATFIYGYVRLKENRVARFVRVGIIQGSVEQDMKWDPAYQQAALDTHVRLSVHAAERGAELIIWPETALPFIFGGDEALTREFVSFQQSLDRDLLTGAMTRRAVKEDFFYANSAVFLKAESAEKQFYDKIHLVPFGEYVPLRGLLFFVERLAVGIGDFKAGSKYTRFRSSHGEFPVLICYEIIFPHLVRKFQSDGGGDFMVTITNDAWFGATSGPYHHFSMAVLRSVENRRPLLRAANTGISAIIDSNGRILNRTSLFERVALVADFPTDRTFSFYSHYGDLFVYLCIVIGLIVAFEADRPTPFRRR